MACYCTLHCLTLPTMRAEGTTGGHQWRWEDRCAVPGAPLEQPVPWRMPGWCFRCWKNRQIPFSGMVSPSPGTGGEGEQNRQSSSVSAQSPFPANTGTKGSSHSWMGLPGVFCAPRDPCAAAVVALCIIECNDEHKISFLVQAAQVQG